MADVTKPGQVTPPPGDTKPAAGEPAKAGTTALGAETKLDPGAADPGTTPAPGKEPASKDGTAPAAPKAPEKYNLTLPENTPFDDADLDVFASEAKQLGLDNEKAQAMVDARVKFVQDNAARYLDELKADPEIGGAKLDGTIKLALRGREVLFPAGTPEAELVNGWFERTGLGNHKALVRAFARLGRMVAEDKIDGAGKGGGRAEKTAADVLYGS